MRAFAALLAVFTLSACAQLIDLDEKYESASIDGGFNDASLLPNVSEGGVLAPTCDNYCLEAKRICTKETASEIFYTEEGCLGACAKYDIGDPADPVGNTLACRMSQLAKAERFGERENYCPTAGPGGGAANPEETSCGSNCEGYCALYAAVCTETPIPDCVNKCKALPDRGGGVATDDFKNGDDSLQCRLAHLTVAAAAALAEKPEDRAAHCAHSGLKSSVQCDLTKNLKPSCKDFCQLTDVACQGPQKVYESKAQCEAVCAALEVGESTALLTNSIYCRRENAYRALTSTASPSLECANAGPAPAQCGRGKCESYCALAQKGCAAEFTAKYQNDLAKCEVDCGLLPDTRQDSVYSTDTAATQKGNLHCRVFNIARALGGDKRPEICQAALGLAGDCK